MKILKNTFLTVIAILSFSALAIAAYPDVKVLLNGVKVTGSGKAWQFDKGIAPRVAQIVMGGASASAATVTLDGSLDGSNWIVLSTFNMASSPAASMVSSATVDYPWPAMRGTITAISSVASAVSADQSAITLMVAE